MMVASSVVEQGTMYFALGDAKLPMVDVRDIAAVVAAILANPTPHAGKTYTLTGPNAVGLDNALWVVVALTGGILLLAGNARQQGSPAAGVRG